MRKSNTPSLEQSLQQNSTSNTDSRIDFPGLKIFSQHGSWFSVESSLQSRQFNPSLQELQSRNPEPKILQSFTKLSADSTPSQSQPSLETTSTPPITKNSYIKTSFSSLVEHKQYFAIKRIIEDGTLNIRLDEKCLSHLFNDKQYNIIHSLIKSQGNINGLDGVLAKNRDKIAEHPELHSLITQLQTTFSIPINPSEGEVCPNTQLIVPIYANTYDNVMLLAQKYLGDFEVHHGTDKAHNSWYSLSTVVKTSNLAYALDTLWHLQDFMTVCYMYKSDATTLQKNFTFVDRILEGEDKEWYAYQMITRHLIDGTPVHARAMEIYNNIGYFDGFLYYMWNIYRGFINFFSSEPPIGLDNQHPGLDNQLPFKKSYEYKDINHITKALATGSEQDTYIAYQIVSGHRAHNDSDFTLERAEGIYNDLHWYEKAGCVVQDTLNTCKDYMSSLSGGASFYEW